MRASKADVVIAMLAGAVSGAGADELAGTIASRIPSRETGAERAHLTGDWWGWRTALVDQGVHWAGGYTGEVMSNVSGGLERGSVYAGLLELGLGVDGARLFGVPGMEVRVSSLYPHGESISRYVGDLSMVSNIDAYDTFRLFEFWVQQDFFWGRGSVRLGQLAADEEFAVSELSQVFVNSALGWPPFFSVAAPAPSYPVAALGVRLAVEVGEAVRLSAAVFDGDPGSEWLNNTGTHFRLSDEEGVLAVFEAAFEPGSEMGRWAGRYKLGGWYHSGRFEHQRLDDGGMSFSSLGSSGERLTRWGNWGVYGVVDQPLWREGDGEQGLGLFLRGGGGPSDRNLLGVYGDAGLVYAGLLPGRDEDRVGVGVGWLRFGDEARRASREVAGGGSLDYELVVEATYDWRINSWWSVQPDVQYVMHPGGADSVADALVVGVRSNVVF